MRRGWPNAQLQSNGLSPLWCPLSVATVAYPRITPRASARYWMFPKEAPLPTPSNLPFQTALGGSHTSNRISDSRVGLTVPMTRQNGTDTVTFFPVSWPPLIVTVKGGCTNSAEFTDQGCFRAPASAAQAFVSVTFVLALDCGQDPALRNMKATPITVAHLM